MGVGSIKRMKPKSTVLLVVLLGLTAGLLRAQTPCAGEPGFQKLDFWLGAWKVVDAEGQEQGVNRIEKILSGCAILEHWTGAGGGEGKSLFYYNAVTEAWKQVWVTQNATSPGGLKEKRLIETFDGGGVRFQGEIPLEDNRSYLDRTTLTPLPDGRVRQVIEWSTDGGETWNIAFDAYYIREE